MNLGQDLAAESGILAGFICPARTLDTSPRPSEASSHTAFFFSVFYFHVQSLALDTTDASFTSEATT